jgi:RNA polymerase sigma-70 factor, ECF subfamily
MAHERPRRPRVEYERGPTVSEPDAGRDVARVARVREGDEAAFESIFREHAASLLNFAYGYTRSRDDAEDAVQSVFVKLWMARERWDVRGSLAAYLALAVRNEIRDRAKHHRIVERQRAAVARSTTPDDHHAAQPPLEDLEAAETRGAIQVALARLAPQRRAVCTLRWAYGLSYAEIATRLNLAPKTVERHLALAYKQLRALIPDLPRLG